MLNLYFYTNDTTVILMKLLTTSLNTEFFATQNVVEKILQLRGTQFHKTLSGLLTFEKTYFLLRNEKHVYKFPKMLYEYMMNDKCGTWAV